MADKRIADISHYQGEIDWSKAREELSLVIFRASVGGNNDSRYLDYTDKCGLPYGAYHYVKAGTAEDARTEARFFVSRANAAKHRPLFYIGDIEYEAQTSETTEAVCVAFLEELRAQGCEKIGLYINTKYKWAGASIGLCDIVWVPHWGLNDGNVPAPKYEPTYYCDLWQYTSKGKVSGISVDVDLNLLKGDKDLAWFTEGWTADETISGEGDKGMLNNRNLAAYCERVYTDAWVYWYGTCGYQCSASLYARKKAQYPSEYKSNRDSGYKADIANGKMCADCVGMIKSFFWKSGDISAVNQYQSNNCPDRNADGLFAMCSEKGAIGAIPDIPGLVVHKSGHIGVYVGNGYTVEMKGFAYDCVKAKVQDGSWTEWGRLPESMLTYVDGSAGDGRETLFALGDRTLSKGDAGSDVKALQEKLMTMGYALPKWGADGDYGSETMTAVAQFQLDHGLAASGAFDTATYKAMAEALNPQKDEGNTETELPEGGGDPVYALILEGDEGTLRRLQEEYGGTVYQRA